jgi:hypothetical protein
MIYFFNVGHCLISVTKVLDMRTYQNEHNMLLRYLSILLLPTSKTDNNALDIDAISIANYRVILNYCPIAVGVGGVVECAASLIT